MEVHDQLAALQLRVAMAEATARLVAAEQAAALGRRTTAEHLLATRELEDNLSRHSRSRSRTPPSPPAGQPTGDMARWMQYWDERETRRDHAAAERDARREMQHAAQLAALRGSPHAGGHPCSFIPNKGFSEITPFSGVRGQDLLPWLQLDLDVGDDLILGWDWISSHDLRHLYQAGQVDLRSGSEQLQLGLLPPAARPPPATLSTVISHGEFRRLLRQIVRDDPSASSGECVEFAIPSKYF